MGAKFTHNGPVGGVPAGREFNADHATIRSIS
jgi:hypothetical protein